jgi:hypothetical protein
MDIFGIIQLLIIAFIIYAIWSAYDFFLNYGWMKSIPGYSMLECLTGDDDDNSWSMW